MKSYNLKKRKKVNLIELSDVFRRSAVKFDKEELAAELVKSTRNLVCLSSHYMPEYPDLAENKLVDKKIQKELEHVLEIAEKLKINEIVLPFEKHTSFWHAIRIQDEVIYKLHHSPVKITLHKGVYNKDNIKFGSIKTGTKTALDMGIRGMVALNPELKAKWDYSKFRF